MSTSIYQDQNLIVKRLDHLRHRLIRDFDCSCYILVLASKSWQRAVHSGRLTDQWWNPWLRDFQGDQIEAHPILAKCFWFSFQLMSLWDGKSKNHLKPAMVKSAWPWNLHALWWYGPHWSKFRVIFGHLTHDVFQSPIHIGLEISTDQKEATFSQNPTQISRIPNWSFGDFRCFGQWHFSQLGSSYVLRSWGSEASTQCWKNPGRNTRRRSPKSRVYFRRRYQLYKLNSWLMRSNSELILKTNDRHEL